MLLLKTENVFIFPTQKLEKKIIFIILVFFWDIFKGPNLIFPNTLITKTPNKLSRRIRNPSVDKERHATKHDDCSPAQTHMPVRHAHKNVTRVSFPTPTHNSLLSINTLTPYLSPLLYLLSRESEIEERRNAPPPILSPRIFSPTKRPLPSSSKP